VNSSSKISGTTKVSKLERQINQELSHPKIERYYVFLTNSFIMAKSYEEFMIWIKQFVSYSLYEMTRVPPKKHRDQFENYSVQDRFLVLTQFPGNTFSLGFNFRDFIEEQNKNEIKSLLHLK
jgi:hypothetical protein